MKLQTHGSVIGVTPEMQYAAESVELPPGAELYLFSDGVFEIARPDGSYQLWEEFAQYVQDERPKLEQIEQRMRELHGEPEFDDDFSLLKFAHDVT